jgi:hypothetical protein
MFRFWCWIFGHEYVDFLNEDYRECVMCEHRIPQRPGAMPGPNRVEN